MAYQNSHYDPEWYIAHLSHLAEVKRLEDEMQV